MSEIIPNLYLGDSYDASNINFLRSKKIVTVINCTNNLPFYFKTVREPYRFEYFKCNVNDDLTKKSFKKMSKLLPQMVELIDESLRNNKPTLVHCLKGRQRSASLVAAYLCYSNRCEDVSSAIEFVKTRRSEAFSPCVNFYQEIYAYNDQIRECHKKSVLSRIVDLIRR